MMKRFAAIVFALLFLAACASAPEVAPPPETSTIQSTAAPERRTAREITMSDTITVFELLGGWPNEIWMRNEATGEETLLLAPDDRFWPFPEARINERFFVFWENAMGHRNIMFYDIARRRAIPIESTGQAHPKDFRFYTVEGERVYLDMGHSGMRYFDVSELESGEPIVIACDMPPVFLVTGSIDDVREIAITRTCEATGERAELALSPAQQTEFFTQLHNINILVLLDPLHHSYGVLQRGRLYTVVVHYENDDVDVIDLYPDAIRFIDPDSFAFVVGRDVASLVALIEGYFQ